MDAIQFQAHNFNTRCIKLLKKDLKHIKYNLLDSQNIHHTYFRFNCNSYLANYYIYYKITIPGQIHTLGKKKKKLYYLENFLLN